MSTYFSLPVKTNNSRTGNRLNGNGNKVKSHFEKHKELIQRYQALKPTIVQPISEVDILKRNHQFLRRDGDDSSSTWEDRLAQKYYEKLFKEYCIGDFSRYKTGAVGLRWRSKTECIEGKGHFSCGNMKCDKVKDLHSWEVNFAYLEHGEKKNALVKIRLCPDCSVKLHYRKIKSDKKEAKKKRKYEKLDPEHAKSIVDEEGAPKRIKGDEEHVSDSDSQSDIETDNVWAKPLQLDVDTEKSKEAEIDDYLNQLFA